MIWDVLFEILKLFNLFKPITRAAYLKLSDETWNNIFYLICLKLETFQTCHGSWWFETFRWDLKWDLLFETFETWNLWNLSWGVAYLKLSDETWNEMCYLKFWNFLTFSNPSQELLIWNFQWDLKQYILFDMFETWNFSNMLWELMIWNFQMRLEKEVLFEIFETCNFSNPSWGVAYLKLSDETWNEMCYLKLLKLETFETYHKELLIWNFQMRLEMRCAIWNFWYLKLCSLKLFETFDMPFEDKKVSINPEFRKDQLLAHRVDICHSFICHSLTFIWMLSAVMFVFFNNINIVEHCQH